MDIGSMGVGFCIYSRLSSEDGIIELSGMAKLNEDCRNSTKSGAYF